jgi:hypothetical protein
MLKSPLLLLAPLIFVAGCATQKPVQPLPVSCPAPVRLPPLASQPDSVTGLSFLTELETVLFGSQNAQTPFDYSLQPARGSTKLPARR